MFRLAATLPGEPGPVLEEPILADLKGFLAAFPADSAEWPRILEALKSIFGGGIRSSMLLAAIQTYFRL